MSKLKKAYAAFTGGTSPFGIKNTTTGKDYGLSDSIAYQNRGRTPSQRSSPTRSVTPTRPGPIRSKP